MGFAEFFRQSPPQQSQQPQGQGQGNLMQGDQSTQLQQRGQQGIQPPQGQPGGQQPQQMSNENPPGAQSQGVSLDEFKDLWKMDEKSGGQDSQFPLLNADPSKLKEVADKLDFTQSIPPQLAQKALGGDIGAFAQILNSVARQSFTTALQASSHLVDRQVSSAIDYTKKSLPGQFKQFSVRDSLQSENPQFSNPAVMPLLDVIQQQLAQKFPEASSAELRNHAKKYLSGVVDTIYPGASAKMQPSQQTPMESGDESRDFFEGVRGRQQDANNFDWDSWANAQRDRPTT